MSRLDELIKELCPNGVEYKELGEVFNLKNGYTPSKANKEYWENTDINWFRIEDINTNGRVLSSSIEKVNKKGIKGKLLPKNTLIISTSATIGEYALITEEFLCNQRFSCLIIKKEYKNILSPMFLRYYAHILSKKCKENIKIGNFPSVDMDKFKKFLIPIPPLEVQDEIVRILDTFTALTAELTAELTARKNQYSWYRDYLLKFENKVKIVKLGSIVEVYDGTHQTPDYKTSGIPFVSVENIDSIYSTEKYVSEEDFEKNYKIKPRIDDIFMTRIGTVGKCAIVTKNIPLAYYVSLALLRPNKNKIDARYLKYIIESGIGRKELNKRILFTAVPIKINKGDIDKIEIPLPPLEVQKRIVEVLDNFEKICNDLNIGLPAEIEARQKQYEFYRNYLLTFEEKSRQAILACELASLRSKQQAQNLIKILQYVYGYVELELDKVANITMGVSPSGNSITDIKSEKNIEFHQGKTYFGETMLLQSNVYTNEPKKYAENNSIVMSVRAPVGDTNMVDRKISIGRGLCSILADEKISLTKYLYYYIKSNVDKLKAMSNGSTFEAINSESIRKFTVSLPPLEEQQRIVDILDRFDKLCNDISEGLPAEIEARQKQYEYYREKLLSFKKI